MTAPPDARVSFQRPRWILWLSWIYLAIFAVGVLFGIAWLISGTPPFGLQVRGPIRITLLGIASSALYMAFTIGVVGVLTRDRQLAWLAVGSGWIIAIIQGIQALLQLAHLRLSIPIGAFLYAAYAIGVTKVLTPSDPKGRVRGGMV